MTTIGFVGLGAMGSRIAGRLLDAGNQVYGTNRTRSRAQALVKCGNRETLVAASKRGASHTADSLD
jgi:3-hydroxyisobutyrate dehydrogenase-like beta-hydroxyacid dehydrogenase